MTIPTKFRDFYINTAFEVSKLSTARKLKVGAVLVKNNKILSFGYNGTPPGWDNNCENEIEQPDGSIVLVTKPEVIHAEENAILHVAKSTESSYGASLFITHSPCSECFKTILVAGIKEVYYSIPYRDDSGIELLRKANIKIYHNGAY